MVGMFPSCALFTAIHAQISLLSQHKVNINSAEREMLASICTCCILSYRIVAYNLFWLLSVRCLNSILTYMLTNVKFFSLGVMFNDILFCIR